MMTHGELSRERRQMHRRIRAAVTARRISAAAIPTPRPADDPPPTD